MQHRLFEIYQDRLAFIRNNAHTNTTGIIIIKGFIIIKDWFAEKEILTMGRLPSSSDLSTIEHFPDKVERNDRIDLNLSLRNTFLG